MRILYTKLIFLCFFFFPLLVHGQVVDNKTYIGTTATTQRLQSYHHPNHSISIGFDILPGSQTTSPRLSAGYALRVTPFTAAIGAAFTYYNDPLSLLPIYIALKYQLIQAHFFPFISVKTGYNFSILTDTKTPVEKHKGGLLFNPAIGVQFTLGKEIALYLTGGYDIDKASFRQKQNDRRTITTEVTYKRFVAGMGLIF